MSETRKLACGSLPGKMLLASVALLWGCADLAMETDFMPAEITLSPDTGMFTVGQPTQLEYVLRNGDGDVMHIPGWAPPLWELSNGRIAEVTRDGIMTGTWGGRLDVNARLADVTSAKARFRMNPYQVRMSAVFYLNQVAQNRRGSVSLIAGRPALLRVFAIADQVNWLEPPAVQVALLHDGEVVFEQRLPPETRVIPTDVQESNLVASYDVPVPGSLIQPGARLVVELDPEGVVRMAPGSRPRYPVEGAMELDVIEPPLLRQIFVPTIATQAPDTSVYDWTDGLNPESPQLQMGRTLLPVGPMEVEVRETFRTDANLSTAGGWSTWIREIRVLYEQEGNRGYYYGVASISRPAYGGLGFVGYPVSVGLPSAGVYAHEVGHNMNLSHAPCGGAGGPDPNYPYDDGSIGIWGYDAVRDQLVNPGTYKDLMGYCGPDWVSDYHFSRATDHRLDGDGGVDLDGGSIPPGGADRGEMLVVWGSVGAGRMSLDPAFVVEGPQALPEAGGPYRVDGLGVDGQTEFSLSFTPTPLEFGGSAFVFLVPYEPEWADNLDRLVLTGPEGEHALTRDGGSEMAVLTDPSTGRIRAMIRDWDGGPIPGEGSARVTITRGVPAGAPR